VTSSAPSVGYCNTMGTATTMNSLAEALGMQLPGSAAIPAPYRERGQMAYATGKRIVDMVREDLKPSDIMTRQAFENAIVTNSALGGSTNAPIHIVAVAKHIGVELSNDDWQTLGHHVPLLTNLQPAGAYLGEDFHRAGGVPAVVAELLKANLLPHPDALTVNGRSIGENCANRETENPDVIRPITNALMQDAGFLNLKGSLFDSAIMKTSVISQEFRDRYLSNPDDRDAFEGVAVVFDGPEDYNRTIDDPSLAIDENSILVMRGAGPLVLSGRGRSGQHAAAELPAEEGHHRPALHRRRPPVGDLGIALDPQCLSGGCSRRRTGAAAQWRQGPHRPRQEPGRRSRAAGGMGETRPRARGRRRLQDPAKPDPLAEILPGTGGAVLGRHGAARRRRIPARCAGIGSPRQSLTLQLAGMCDPGFTARGGSCTDIALTC
jgi:hypothetical protein